MRWVRENGRWESSDGRYVIERCGPGVYRRWDRASNHPPNPPDTFTTLPKAKEVAE